MKITRFSDTGIQVNEGDGWQRPAPRPFYLGSFLGGWKPICLRHKLLFQREQRYYEHYSPACEDYTGLDPKPTWPKTNLAILERGFKRVWS